MSSHWKKIYNITCTYTWVRQRSNLLLSLATFLWLAIIFWVQSMVFPSHSLQQKFIIIRPKTLIAKILNKYIPLGLISEIVNWKALWMSMEDNEHKNTFELISDFLNISILVFLGQCVAEVLKQQPLTPVQ